MNIQHIYNLFMSVYLIQHRNVHAWTLQFTSSIRGIVQLFRNQISFQYIFSISADNEIEFTMKIFTFFKLLSNLQGKTIFFYKVKSLSKPCNRLWHTNILTVFTATCFSSEPLNTMVFHFVQQMYTSSRIHHRS